MRIIAGQRRGHKIDGPRPSASTKPTSDLVRESLFRSRQRSLAPGSAPSEESSHPTAGREHLPAESAAYTI